jgi:hypothetical protein
VQDDGDERPQEVLGQLRLPKQLAELLLDLAAKVLGLWRGDGTRTE